MKWEDSWAERLRFLGEGQVAFVEWPNGRTLKIEAYTDQKTAEKLVAEFGGKAAPAHDWVANQPVPKKPTAVRGQLRVFSDSDQFATRTPARNPSTRDILIPAGMAFGTGDHATTMTCLRMLCDKTKSLAPKWNALDAGCGTGILGIAASALGAARVDGFDFDPLAVRAAKENVKRNPDFRMTVRKIDIYDWTPDRIYQVVLANLFSDLLIQSAPKLASALEPGGTMILSGILRHQFPGVEAAFESIGVSVERVVFLGKWSAATCIKEF
ncbi:MAG: 50S ribosomal protein L11 methyltransferase [Chthoniobacterales bacterium]